MKDSYSLYLYKSKPFSLSCTNSRFFKAILKKIEAMVSMIPYWNVPRLAKYYCC